VRSLPRLGSGEPPWPLHVFATDESSVQLTWRASPPELLRLEIGGSVLQPAATPKAELALSLLGPKGIPPPGGARRRALDSGLPGGPGSAVVEGLLPGTTYDVVASARGAPRFLAARFRTLKAPQGRLLCQFATISDLHVGEKFFGVLGRIHDPSEGLLDGSNPHAPAAYPARALEAAIDEAVAWGAQLLVVKGDLTRQTVAAEVRDVARLLARSPIPVEVLLGNHDNKFGVDVRAIFEKHGMSVPWHPTARDLPGLRLVLVNTVHGDPHNHRGQLPPEMSREVVSLAAGSAEAGNGAGAWIALHHPPEMHSYPTVYPPGVPWRESRLLLRSLAAAQPSSFVTCGHRHRNRRYGFGPVVISEVGSTKDYPGVWAGYRVYEGGIVQVVRRTARPDVLSWTEATRRAVNGQWGRWSPGSLADRCFTVEWGDVGARG